MKCECIDVQYSAVQDHFNSAQMHRKVEMGTLQKKKHPSAVQMHLQ